jgi:hypothetical protein
MSDDKVVDLRPKQKVRPLTAKQLGFVRSILSDDNLSQAQAYRDNYDASNMKDHVVWKEANRLFQNPAVSRLIKEGRARQADIALHSGASLRGVLEKELMKIITAADDDGNATKPDAIRLKAMDQLSRFEKVGAYLDRSETTTVESLTEQEVREQLEAKLSKAFGAETG